MLRSAFLLALFHVCCFQVYSQNWSVLADSAREYRKTNTDKAIGLYIRAKDELKKDSSNTNSYARICDELGVCFYKKRNYIETEKYYREALHVREQIFPKDHEEYIGSLFYLGKFYYNIGEYEKARPNWEQVTHTLKNMKGRGDTIYANSCYYLGLLYRDMGKYDQADTMLQEALNIQEQSLVNDHADYIATYNALATLYYRMGHYTQAQKFYEDAKQLSEKNGLKLTQDYVSILTNFAILYRDMGQYEKAAPLFLEAKQIQKDRVGDKDQAYAASCNSLAILYRLMGQYEKAETLFQTAKKIWETKFGNEDPKYATSCNNLAALYKDMGNYIEAERLYLEAKQIREKRQAKSPRDYASACFNLANLYKEMKRFDEAKSLYLQANEIDERTVGKSDPAYASSCTGLAAYYLQLGDYEKAEPLYLQALDIQKSRFGKNHPDYASTCSGLGVLYEKQKKFEKAERNYKEAKLVWLDVLGNRHPNYGASCANLANLYWIMGEPEKASAEFKESFDVNVNTLDAVFQFTNEKEKASFVKNVSGEDDKAYSFYVSKKVQSELPYAISLFHRNLILYSLQALKQHLYSSSDSLLSTKYDEWMNLKQYLAILYSMPFGKRMEDPLKIEKRADQLEKELVNNISGLERQRKKISWKDIQDKLLENEASIEFASFHYNPVIEGSEQNADSILYVAFVLKKNAPLPVTIPLCDEKQLSKLFSNFINKNPEEAVNGLYVQDKDAVGGKNAPKTLYDLVWRPMEKELKDIRTIYFAPAGMLHNIAFSAIPITGRETLSDRYKLVQLASTTSVTDSTTITVQPADELVLYGGITYDPDSVNTGSEALQEETTRGSSWRYLPSTANEINDIETLGRSYCHVIPVSGSSATEESLKSLNGVASPAVLHIATHGFFYSNPRSDNEEVLNKPSDKAKVFMQSDDPLLRSGLVFAHANNIWNKHYEEAGDDGILTSYEVSNLYLPNTKLAVLSACETGLGDIQGSEGVYGLQRAFKISGVQNLVMSLWQVPSEETAEFMQAFYKNIFSKETVNDAFYHAQNQLKEKYRDEPYKWAAWILVK